jgi:hypothetical protein
VFVSGLLWALYAVYEYLIVTQVLCEKDCNIRVDLVFFVPILALVTFCAYQAYQGRPGQLNIIVAVLGILGLLVVGLMAEDRYGGPASLVIFAALAGWAGYMIWSKRKARAAAAAKPAASAESGADGKRS